MKGSQSSSENLFKTKVYVFENKVQHGSDNTVRQVKAQRVWAPNWVEWMCVCDYKKDSFSRGQWEEVEPSHRRKVAAQEMM